MERATQLCSAIAASCAALVAAGCGIEGQSEDGHSATVFSDLRTDLVRPAVIPEPVDAQSWQWPAGMHPRVVIVVRDLGSIEIELFPSLAPRTVANFQQLADDGFYDGTTFHRVIAGFMIQGGDPNSRDDDPRNDGKGGASDTILDEFSSAPHLRGVVSMANKGDPNTASSQFFIVHADRQDLDAQYTVFGRVVSGMDIVDAVAHTETDGSGRWGPKDRPLRDVVVATVRSSSGTTLADQGSPLL